MKKFDVKDKQKKQTEHFEKIQAKKNTEVVLQKPKKVEKNFQKKKNIRFGSPYEINWQDFVSLNLKAKR
jgi:hypothetical protein